MIFNTKVFRFLLPLIACCSYSAASSAQGYTWSQKADYGGGEIYDPFSFTIGNKGYVGTGRMIPGINTNEFWEYDPVIDSWSQKSNFPGTGRYGAKGFAIGNYGFAGTGWDPSATTDFYRYDPVTNIWTAIADFGGSARYTGTTFSLGNKGYLGLGYSPCKDDFWQYDPTLNTWAQIASFPGGVRQAASAVTANNFAYVGFGACNTNLYTDMYRYDPILNNWTALSSFPGQGRSSIYSFVIGDAIYVGMGDDYQNNFMPFTVFEDFWKYDIFNDAWAQLPNPPFGKRFAGVSFSINNRGYIGMGSDTGHNVHFTGDFWEYGPESTGIKKPSGTNSLTVYPSPAREWVELRSPLLENVKNSCTVQMFNSEGKLCRTYTVLPHNGKVRLELGAELTGSLYLCTLHVADSILATAKIVVMK